MSEGIVGVCADEGLRDAREPRAETERLPVRVGPNRRMREQQQRPRVVGHRARDVEQENEPPRLSPPSPPGALDRLAARAERAAKRSPQVGSPGTRTLAAARPSRRREKLELPHQRGDVRELLVRHLGEALLAQELALARERDVLLDDLHDARARRVVDRDVLDGGAQRQPPGPVQVLRR